jgi:hypothetical protein
VPEEVRTSWSELHVLKRFRIVIQVSVKPYKVQYRRFLLWRTKSHCETLAVAQKVLGVLQSAHASRGKVVG